MRHCVQLILRRMSKFDAIRCIRLRFVILMTDTWRVKRCIIKIVRF